MRTASLCGAFFILAAATSGSYPKMQWAKISSTQTVVKWYKDSGSLSALRYWNTKRGWYMRCPFCGNVDTQVKDSRPAEDHVAIRRRRFCPACGGRFTTYERVQLRDLVVIKSNGRREDFDRSKLERSIRIALQKRPVEPERMDQMISGIVRRLESMGDTDIPSTSIGEIVMEALARIDTVAFVRFASVYKNFQAADDFDKFVSELRPNLPPEE